jgi:hypothetical protein
MSKGYNQTINRMKKFLTLALLLLLYKSTFAQLNTYNAPDDLFMISVGPSKMFLNNNYFNRWTVNNYRLIDEVSTGIDVDLAVTGKYYNAGLLLSYSAPVLMAKAYFGRRLTNPFSPVSSWLNIEIGEISAKFTNIAPVNYTLTPDEMGQNLELHYNAGYIGLMSKNYLNFLHGNIKIGRVKIPVNSGFYVSAGFTPFARNWHYGYYRDGDTVFTSRKVNSIPKLSKFYANTGFFVGF